MGVVGARDGEPHRLGPGRQEKFVESEFALVSQLNLSLVHVDERDADAELQIDEVFSVEGRRLDEDPIRRRLAGQKVLGKIGAVDGGIFVGGEHDEVTVEPIATQPLSRSEAGPATANDDEPAAASRRSRFCADRGGGLGQLLSEYSVS